MIGDADDLMLKLMQVADDVEPPAEKPAAGNNPLSALKPYPYHDGCGGMIEFQLGVDDEDEEHPVFLGRFVCLKCQKEEIVPCTEVIENGRRGVDVIPPKWVKEPSV